METTYFDMPLNFISRKGSEAKLSSGQKSPNFHSFSVPIIQIPVFEKRKHEHEAKKKMEAQKTLKLKLKALGQVSPVNNKIPTNLKALTNAEYKLDDILLTTSYANSLKNSQSFKTKTLPKPEINPFLSEDDIIEDVSVQEVTTQRHYNIPNLPNLHSKSTSHSPRHFMIKQKFTPNPKITKPNNYGFEPTLKAPQEFEVNTGKKNVQTLRKIFPSTPNLLSRSGINSLRSFIVTKSPEIQQFKETTEPNQENENSPPKMQIAKNQRSYFKRHVLKKISEFGPIQKENNPALIEKVQDPEQSTVNLGSENLENRAQENLFRISSTLRLSPLHEEIFENSLRGPSPIMNAAETFPTSELNTVKSETFSPIRLSGLNSLVKVITEPHKPIVAVQDHPKLTLKKASSEAKLNFASFRWKEKNSRIPSKFEKYNPFIRASSVKKKIISVPVALNIPETTNAPKEVVKLTQRTPRLKKNSSVLSEFRRKLVSHLNHLKKLKITPREVYDR